MDDERLSKIESEKQNAINQSNNFYNDLLNDNQNLYNEKINYSNNYEQTQNDMLDKQLEYQKNIIQQQKDKVQQNFKTESNKALNDYTSFINPYGYEAEAMAGNGLLNSGVSETAKLGGWNSYQNRLASANKAMQDAFTSFDNDLNQAILNNDVQKAQNALEKLQMQIDFADSFYSNKMNIGQDQLNNNQNLNSEYYDRYQDVINQINYEREQEETRKQYEEQFAYQKQMDALEQSNWEREYALANASKSSGGSSSNNSSPIIDLNSQTIKTDYYQGLIHPDTAYGTFNATDSNGVKYMPNNVNGDPLSKVTKNGKTITVGDIYVGATGTTGAKLDKQKIWQTSKGEYFVWDGSVNDYINVTDVVSYALSGGNGPFIWGS